MKLSSFLVYGSKTRPLKVEHEVKLELKMIMWICGFILKERKKSAELRELLGFYTISLVITKDILDMWNLVKVMLIGLNLVHMIDVHGFRPRGRPGKSWSVGDREDMKVCTDDWNKRRRKIKGKPAETMSVYVCVCVLACMHYRPMWKLTRYTFSYTFCSSNILMLLIP